MKAGKLRKLLMFVLALALVVSSIIFVTVAEDGGDPDGREPGGEEGGQDPEEDPEDGEPEDGDQDNQEPEEDEDQDNGDGLDPDDDDPDPDDEEEPGEEPLEEDDLDQNPEDGDWFLDGEIINPPDLTVNPAALQSPIAPASVVVIPPASNGNVISRAVDGNGKALRYQLIHDDNNTPGDPTDDTYVIAVYPTLSPNYSQNIKISFNSTYTLVRELIPGYTPAASGTELDISLPASVLQTIGHADNFFEISFGGQSYFVTYYATAGLTMDIGTGGSVTVNGNLASGRINAYVDPGTWEIIPTADAGYTLSGFSLTDSSGNAVDPVSENTYQLDSDEYTLAVSFSGTGSGSSSSSRTRNGGQSGGTIPSAPSFLVPGSAVTESYARTVVAQAITEAQASGSTTATTKLTNAGSISRSVLTSITQSAFEAGLVPLIQADTVSDSGVVQLRMTFNPTGLTGDVQLGGAVSGPAANRVRTLFNNYYANQFAVVSLNHWGAYGTPVRMAVKLDLSGMDTENLVLYHYNPETNSYSMMQNPNMRIDEGGYLWFTTSRGGAVVVSEGAITK